MAEHPNVALVREALGLVAAGDAEGLLELWTEDMRYFAFDGSAPPAEFDGRAEFLDMMRSGRQMMSEHSYETIDIRAIGEELVVAHLRTHATSSRTGRTVSGDYLGVFRVQDGRLAMGCDFVNNETEALMAEIWT